jgi:excinuclease UvrABC nuclease subunit
VAEQQLNLFATRSVLCERFTPAFFRSIPRRPGVYLMSDEQNRIIYVGKAKDLRARLGSYRYADASCSRKTARLIARVKNIRWQVHSTEEEALLEENRLLRELRPRFNRMNTWPKAYRFVRIAAVAAGVELSLSSEGDRGCYGAFKGASRETFGALLRLLASITSSYSTLPRRLVCERGPLAFEFSEPVARHWMDELHAFLRGKGESLLERLSASSRCDDTAFHVLFRAADLVAVEHFYRIGPQRNHRLQQHHGTEDPLIAQEELDDWIVRGQRFQRGEGSVNAT